MDKRLTFSEKITIITFFCMGLHSFVRAYVWSVNQESVLHDSMFYAKLHSIMPIWVWGIILAILSLFLMAASVFYSQRRVTHWVNAAIAIGGFGSSFFYMLMASASLFNAINMITPLQFTILAVMFGAIGFIGGADIARKR